MNVLRGMRNVAVSYGIAALALYGFGWRCAVVFGIGVCIGLVVGHRAGRRQATYDAARDIARSRPREVFDYLDTYNSEQPPPTQRHPFALWPRRF